MQQECRNCGAQIEYSAESQSLVCPYCDTVNVIRKTEDALPVDPEFIIPLAMTPDVLEKNVYGYLAQGDYTPDDMLESVVFLRKESFYVPVYTFEINYDVNWTATFGYDQQEPYTAHRDGKAYTAYRTVTDWRPASGRDVGTFEVSAYAGVDLTAVALNPVELVPFTVLQGERTGFDPAFMQGLRAEAFSVPEHLAYSTLDAEVQRKITLNVQRHAQGNHQRDWNWNLASLTPSTSTLFVPVSYVVFDYEGKNYHYWSDGLGGESTRADPLPIDERRRKNVRKGFVPVIASFAGLLIAVFYTMSSTDHPDAMVETVLIGMLGPLFALIYGLLRRFSILGYSRKLRKSILAQIHASSASVTTMDDRERKALAKSMRRPVRSLLARTELDRKVIPTVSAIGFLLALVPAFFSGASSAESTVAPAAPAAGASQAGKRGSAAPPQPQPKSSSQAAHSPASSQDEVNYCLLGIFYGDLSKSERAFIRQNLKSGGPDFADADVRINARETSDSTGGPEFKCAGEVTVVSKSKKDSILSYRITYSAFKDEGFGGVDLKSIARTEFLSSETEMSAKKE